MTTPNPHEIHTTDAALEQSYERLAAERDQLRDELGRYQAAAEETDRLAGAGRAPSSSKA
jgi:hypothetical protein